MISNENNLGFKLNILNNLVSTYFDKQLKLVLPDISPAQFSIILYLYNHENIVTQDKLEIVLQVSHPTIRNMIKSMSKKGILTTKKLNQDKRKILVLLTNESKNLIANKEKDINKLVNDTNEKITEGLCKEDKKALNRIIYRIISSYGGDINE